MNWQLIKKALRRCGIDITRTRNVPVCTFLGLGNRPVDLILDVGANVGQFARYVRTFFPAATIHCFEPIPEVASQLRSWAQTLRPESVKVWEVALGDREGIAELIEHTDHRSSSSFLESSEIAEQMYPFIQRQCRRNVQIDTLDGWVKAHNIQINQNTLLKLDVQGYESVVLRGGREMLSAVGYCVVEVTPMPVYKNQAEFSELVALLSDAGLQYLGNLEQFVDADGFPLYVDAVFGRREMATAVHSDRTA